MDDEVIMEGDNVIVEGDDVIAESSSGEWTMMSSRKEIRWCLDSPLTRASLLMLEADF